MDELEQLACDVRGFATEIRRLGYSSVAGGHENQFLELSERMMRQADHADGHSQLDGLTLPRNRYPAQQTCTEPAVPSSFGGGGPGRSRLILFCAPDRLSFRAAG